MPQKLHIFTFHEIFIYSRIEWHWFWFRAFVYLFICGEKNNTLKPKIFSDREKIKEQADKHQNQPAGETAPTSQPPRGAYRAVQSGRRSSAGPCSAGRRSHARSRSARGAAPPTRLSERPQRRAAPQPCARLRSCAAVGTGWQRTSLKSGSSARSFCCFSFLI